MILGTETSGWIPQTHQQIAPRACSSERAAGGWGLRSTAARAPLGQLTTAPRAGGSADGEVRRGRVRTRAGAARRGSAEGGGWEQGMLGWPRRLKGARGDEARRGGATSEAAMWWTTRRPDREEGRGREKGKRWWARQDSRAPSDPRSCVGPGEGQQGGQPGHLQLVSRFSSSFFSKLVERKYFSHHFSRVASCYCCFFFWWSSSGNLRVATVPGVVWFQL